MKRVTSKIKPVGGFSQIFHIALTAVLPVLLYVLVRLNLPQLAVLMIFLSKWRIFSVRPRYWFMLLKANAVDITVGIATVMFMINTGSALVQIIWATAYATWLVLIKPNSSVLGISLQAFIAFVYGLSAVYLEWGASTSVVLLVMTWLICYVTASHFFSSFDEPKSAFLSNSWALFGACLAWLLSHDLLYFQVYSQVTLILLSLGFGLATIYYLDKVDKKSRLIELELIFMMVAVVILNIIVALMSANQKIGPYLHFD